MQFLKKFSITCLALGATVLTALSQPSAGTGGFAGTYAANYITLPYSTLAAGYGTNLLYGWTNTTYFTNSSILYTNNLNTPNFGFYTNTIISSNVAPTYPEIYIGLQDSVQFGFSFVAGGAGTNIQVWARSLDGTPQNAETVNLVTLQAGCTAATGPTPVTCFTNMPNTWIGGDGYLMLVSNIWLAAAATMTNAFSTNAVLVPGPGIQYAIKRKIVN